MPNLIRRLATLVAALSLGLGRHSAAAFRYARFGGTRTALKSDGRQLWPVVASLFSSDVFTFASAISWKAGESSAASPEEKETIDLETVS